MFVRTPHLPKSMKDRDKHVVLRIAQKIRQDVIDLFGTTEGVCDNACSRLEKQLKKRGYDCKTEIGYFTTKNEWSFHWWIELYGMILDITADQFGYSNILFAPKETLPMYSVEEPVIEEVGKMKITDKFLPALKKLGITMQVSETDSIVTVELQTVQSRASNNIGKAKKMFPATWEGKKLEVKTRQ